MQTLEQKIKENETIVPTLKKLAIPIFVVVSSFFMCNAGISEGVNPMGIAYLSAMDSMLFPYSAFSVAAGYFFFLMGRNSLRYLAAMLLFAGVRAVMGFIFQKITIVKTAAAASLCLFATGIFTLLPQINIGDAVLVLSESIISFACGILFSRFIKALTQKTPVNSVTALCFGMTLAVIYAGTCQISLFGFSVAKAFAVAVIVYSSFYLSNGVTLSAGICVGICGFLNGDASSLAFFPAGALMAAAFSPAGKMLSIASFTLASLSMTFIYSGIQSFVPLILQMTVGFCLALAAPKSIGENLGFITMTVSDGELFKNSSKYRLSKTSLALSEIGEITEKVSQEVEKINGEPVEKYINNAINNCCKGCKSSPLCWQKNYSDSKEAVTKLFYDAKNGVVPDINGFLRITQCENVDKMIKCTEAEGKKYKDFLNAKSYSYNLRYVVCDQFLGMSQLISSVVDDVAKLVPISEKENKIINSMLLNEGAMEGEILSCRDRNKKVTVSAVFSPLRIKRMNLVGLTNALSEILSSPLSDPCEEKIGEDYTRLIWRSVAPFTAEYDYYQLACQNGRLCGDSVAFSKDINDNPLFFLSDGMGVGGNAAVDSTMTTSLLSRLMNAGCSFPAALKIVNSSLLSCKDERLCTIDALIADYSDSTITVYKAGAAPTYILRNGQCAKIEKSSLPAGILGGAEAAKSVFTIKDGDLILMVSDGVTESGTGWISSQLCTLCAKKPGEISKNIVETAKKRNLTDRNDDMTALCIKFSAAAQ